ncbi:MAG: rsmE [Acidimicrobiaceae bacterium]|nr:rsmE [Acidimicrobiaceae bacterium]
MPSALRSASALVFVTDLEDLELGPGDAHHLVDVLRVGPAESVIASDGRGRWRTCALATVAVASPQRGAAPLRRAKGTRGATRGDASDVQLRATGDVVVAPIPSRPVTVGFAMTKGDRTEWTVQKLTELGVDRIWPLLTARTVVRLGPGEAERRVNRLRRIAREAAAQSRRPFLAEVVEPTPLRDAVVSLAGGGADVLLAEPGGGSLAATTAAVLVGPEGGWAPDELECGLCQVDLGPTVLRSETAAVVAGTLLTALRAGSVGAP